MPTTIVAQNGAVIETDTSVTTTGCKAAAKKKQKKTGKQKLAQALTACNRDKSKSRRSACAKLARRRYAAELAKKASRHAKNARR